MGLHASEHPFDALTYAPGKMLHKVILRGDLQSHGDPIDKYVGRERKITASMDAEKLLREFARWCALQDAAWDATWDATGDAAAARRNRFIKRARQKLKSMVDDAFHP